MSSADKPEKYTNAVAYLKIREDCQTGVSINSLSSLTHSVQSVIISAANSKHKLKPHSSFKSVSHYLCPLDELNSGRTFSCRLPNIYILLDVRNFQFSSTFSFPPRTILNQTEVIILLQSLLTINDSRQSLPLKHTNAPEYTPSLKPENSLNGAFAGVKETLPPIQQFDQSQRPQNIFCRSKLH